MASVPSGEPTEQDQVEDELGALEGDDVQAEREEEVDEVHEHVFLLRGRRSAGSASTRRAGRSGAAPSARR